MSIRKSSIVGCWLLLIGVATLPVRAQSTGTIQGVTLDAETNAPLPGVQVLVRDTKAGSLSDEHGAFIITGMPAGSYTLEGRFVGYRPARQTIYLAAGDTLRVRLNLEPQAVDLGGIEVMALRPDLQPQSRLHEAEVREANPRDSGELLRMVPGVDAVRRGPVGLDPVVRGLRETEIGTYLDGTRIFPGGPARMDSPLSHLDPSAIESIEVVKGPYALTWGAGNLSAIRVETQPMQAIPEGWLHGRVSTGYDTNFGAYEGALAVAGRDQVFSYRLHGAWRAGNDYTSGGDAEIPADFLSREVRGKLGVQLAPGSAITLAGGYQNQENLDYPGRLLDADYFDVYNVSARWELERTQGLLRTMEVLAYLNDVAHGMDNDGKPTAEANPDRMPPFPLRVTVASDVSVQGGRVAAELAPRAGVQVEVGGDVYRAHRDAVRHIERRDTGMLMFEDLMWPEATITDAGVFTRLSQTLSPRLRVVGTARLDLVWADADTISTFFREHVDRDLEATEQNLSGAVTLSFVPEQHWVVSMGVGSAVRTADATERYSDRIPASKAQTSAEFVGNPSLKPERSTQADLWVEATYPRLVLSLNAFGRRMDNYITLTPTALPKRLPLSPETVFQYVNGEALFWGTEASVAYLLADALRAEVSTRYLWGQDRQLDEPALGVMPFGVSTGLRYEPAGRRYFAQGTLHVLAEQDRVATTRGEVPTESYVTADVRGGIRLGGGLALQAGVTNLTGVDYINHLNAKNPFTGHQIPEPGRVFFTDLTLTF